jgi:hypothetical protein
MKMKRESVKNKLKKTARGRSTSRETDEERQVMVSFLKFAAARLQVQSNQYNGHGSITVAPPEYRVVFSVNANFSSFTYCGLSETAFRYGMYLFPSWPYKHVLHIADHK